MTQYENDCCDCATGAFPCVGNLCPMRNAPHHYCDDCGEEAELYYFDGEELCKDCVIDRLERVKQ